MNMTMGSMFLRNPAELNGKIQKDLNEKIEELKKKNQ